MSFSGKFIITKQDNIQYNFFRMKRKLTGLAIMTFVILGILLALVRYAQRNIVLGAKAFDERTRERRADLLVAVDDHGKRGIVPETDRLEDR